MTEPTEQRQHVLVIDDDPRVLFYLERVLSREFRVDTVADAREALDLVQAHAYDAILCDLVMPHMDGARFHDALHEVRPAAAERIVFMTGGAVTRSSSDLLGRVENRCLTKPFTPRDIRDAVKEACERAEAPA